MIPEACPDEIVVGHAEAVGHPPYPFRQVVPGRHTAVGQPEHRLHQPHPRPVAAQPAVLEQRIGRVDRIGQKNDIIGPIFNRGYALYKIGLSKTGPVGCNQTHIGQKW